MAIKRIMSKEDVARAVAAESGFYIKNCRVFLDALEKVIIANMKLARFEEDSEMYLAKGVYLTAYRVPERMSKDPRNGEDVLSGEKCIPKAYFSQHFRNKLFSIPKGYEKKRREKMYRENRKNKLAQQENGGDDS